MTAAHAAALAALPLITASRLRRLIALGDPAHTHALLLAGERPLNGIEERVWRAWSATEGLVETMSRRCAESGVEVTWTGDPGYPRAWVDDTTAPAVVFYRGDLAVLENRRAGIIGTRRASRAGAAFSRSLGRDLSEEGIAVVSGLARGIDVHAHRGVLGSRTGVPIAVVAGGVDVVYPPEHAHEWEAIAERGIIISEAPPRTPPETFRFPLRNRIIALLCEVLVVVESRAAGGSMITVGHAMRRDVTVMAVPGSPRMPVSEGTNALLSDGCAPVTSAQDIVVALGLDTRRTTPPFDPRARPDAAGRALLGVLAGEPRSSTELVLATGQDIFTLGLTLGRLEAAGWVAHDNGWWEALPG